MAGPAWATCSYQECKEDYIVDAWVCENSSEAKWCDVEEEGATCTTRTCKSEGTPISNDPGYCAPDFPGPIRLDDCWIIRESADDNS